MRESLISTLLFLAFALGIFIGYLAGAHNAEAAGEHTVEVYGIVRMADTGGVAPPTMKATPTRTLITPTPVKEPLTTWPTDRALTEGEMDALLAHVGFPRWTWPTAKRIAFCESRWRPWATGSASEMGIFQIHPRWHHDATYDVVGNAQAAYRISDGGRTWEAWSCQ